jgi:hypothetical protein
MEKEPQNLMEALLDEITRVQELIQEYKSLPKNAGILGAALMSEQIKTAKRQISEGDTIGMLQSYEGLKNCE